MNETKTTSPYQATVNDVRNDKKKTNQTGRSSINLQQRWVLWVQKKKEQRGKEKADEKSMALKMALQDSVTQRCMLD